MSAPGSRVPVVLPGHRGYVDSAIATHLASLGIAYVGIDSGNLGVHRGKRAEVLINANGSSDRAGA